MKLVLFDMDHTLVPCDTGTVWNGFLARRGLISETQHEQRQKFLFDYQAGILDMEASYRYELGILQLFPKKEREELLQEFFDLVIKPAISVKAIAQYEKHRKAGDFIILITATVEDIAKPVAEFFGVDHLIATKGKVNEAGEYTGEVEIEPCMGRGKLVHLEEWLQKTGNNPEHYTFYSDSHNDMPLLEQVDVPIAVDPDDILREIALANDWQIMSFVN